MNNEPCVTCPWRKSSIVGGADIPGFDIDLMRRLRNTVGEGDGFYRVMACHYSVPEKEIVCRGYVAQEGYHNINVRLLASKGELCIHGIQEACRPLALWPSFAEMLAAYEAAQ